MCNPIRIKGIERKSHMSKIRLGLAMCGSFCTYERAFAEFEKIREGDFDIFPIMSEISAASDTRFGRAEDHIARLEAISGKKVINTIVAAEPIGPKKLLDVLVIAPCTGNTMAKISRGVTDSSVSMACKSHLRNQRPVVIALASNDILGGNAENLGRLFVRKNIYFLPMYQDDPEGKPASVFADLGYLQEAITAALEGRQLQPLFIGKP